MTLVLPVLLLAAALAMLGAVAYFSGGAGSTPASSAAADAASMQAGRRSFETGAALQGTITGQTLALPATALRCANCHAAGSGSPLDSIGSASAAGLGDGGSAKADNGGTRSTPTAFGPPLGGANLIASKSRRRGPASSFDERTFCRLLRTGVDPAHIVVAQAMPRYTLSDESCGELWMYLTRSGA